MGKQRLLYQDLITLLYTEEDVFQLINELEIINKDLYASDAVFETVLSARISSRFFQALQVILRQAEIDGSRTEQISSLLSSIISEIRNLPVIHLTFAFDLTPLLLGQISHWLRENVAEGSVMDITIDKKIIGGFLMDFNGRYWDLSIRASFEKLFVGGNLIYLVQRTG